MERLLEHLRRLRKQLFVLHAQLKQLHAPFLPELASLVPKAAPYAQAILQLGPSLSLSEAVQVTPECRLALSMALQLRRDTVHNWETVSTIAEEIVTLSSQVDRESQDLQQRIQSCAPNLCALLDVPLATALVLEAGGVAALAKLPASTIQVLGKGERTSQLGKALLPQQQHAGCLMEHELINGLPIEHLRAAIRLLAAKTALAARLDLLGGKTLMGSEYRVEVKQKLDKLSEPLSLRPKAPIAPPPLQTSKKRGGRRARKQRELYRPTEARKLANRLAMRVDKGEEELMVGDKIKGMGMLGDVGRLNLDDRLLKEVKRHAKTHSATDKQVAFNATQGLEVKLLK